MFAEKLDFIYFGNFKHIPCSFRVPNTCLRLLLASFARRQALKY